MSKLVVDASVAVKWLVPTEALAKNANDLLDAPLQLIAPDLMRIEASNAVRRLAIEGLITADQAQERFLTLGELIAVRMRVESSEKHLQTAFNIACKAPKRHVQDTVYLALAIAEGCKLITADDVFFKTLIGTEYEVHVVWLGSHV